MSASGSPSPIRQALRATLAFVLVAVVLRALWGVIDRELHDWSLVAVAPLAGLYTYLHASGRHRAIANLLNVLGVGALLLWTTVLLAAWMPATRADVPYVVLVFAFPLVALGLGIRQLRQSRARDSRVLLPLLLVTVASVAASAGADVSVPHPSLAASRTPNPHCPT